MGYFDLILSHGNQSISMVLTWNSMGRSEIWDKYHSYCIENGNFTWLHLVKFYPFSMQHSYYAITNTDIPGHVSYILFVIYYGDGASS